MAQQAFNYLSKQASAALKGKFEKLYDDEATNYLREMKNVEGRKCTVTTVGQLLDVEAIHALLETRSLLQVKRLKEKQNSMKNISKKNFINSVAALDIVKTVHDHGKLLIYKIFVKKLNSGSIKCTRI